MESRSLRDGSTRSFGICADGPRILVRGGVACFGVMLAACGSSPTTPQNAPPAVTVAFVGAAACTPKPGAPCTLDVVATASDPDGDQLQYTWSGCATGSSARATCTVERPGQVVASVEVNDGHGHPVRVSATGEGTEIPNGPPTLTATFARGSTCELRPGHATCTVNVVAHATDPDGDPLRYEWSGCASGTAAEAACKIDRLGPAVATVTASDDHGHTVSASVTAQAVEPRNRPPVVTAAFEGPSSCTPLPRKPCTVTVVAQAVDPDGDAVRVSWTGCASGTATRATCTIDRPGPVVATVVVDDGHGHTARGTLTASGMNRAPEVALGPKVNIFSPRSFGFFGGVKDPDEGFLCAREYCESITASGACASPVLECSCLAGMEGFVIGTAASGICTVTVTVQDSWGLRGTGTLSFDVGNPPR